MLNFLNAIKGFINYEKDSYCTKKNLTESYIVCVLLKLLNNVLGKVYSEVYYV